MIGKYFIYLLSMFWPSPVAPIKEGVEVPIGSPEWNDLYAKRRFQSKIQSGIGYNVIGLKVLEIGSGHGGISCALALAGARYVEALDINEKHIAGACEFKNSIENKIDWCHQLPITFSVRRADQTGFDNEAFDLVYADNAFEHFENPEAIIKESYRVLKKGGVLFVPIFSSIYSKYGLHLKHGIKIPWANLFFSEKTIVGAVKLIAKKRPQLLDIYPGLKGTPNRVSDLREYKDLNNITYKGFRKMALQAGFELLQFKPYPTLLGRMIQKLPLLKNSILMDVFSTGAMAVLRKQ